MGTLYVAATPIGNLDDITLRVIDLLKSVDFIVCEDTRHTLNLLNHFGISKKLISCHEYSSISKIDEIISKIEQGADIAYVSDAGTPAVSDPGRMLVHSARAKGINVIGLPGASAGICAYSISGILSKRFVFYGFLSDKAGTMAEEVKSLKNHNMPVILYVSPHKVIKTLNLIRDVYPQNVTVHVLRELTKIHEEYLNGTPEDIIGTFSSREPKGEFVFIIEFFEETEEIDPEILITKIDACVNDGMSVKDAIKTVSADSGISKNRLYAIYHK